MLERRIYLGLLRISYYKSLLCGYFPAPINWHTLQFSEDKQRTYLWVSGVVHLVSLAVIPLTYTNHVYEHSYMTGKPLIRLLYSVTNATKVLTVVLLIRNIWWHRRKAMCEIRHYIDQTHRYRAAFGPSHPNDRRLRRQLERLMIWKFFANLGTTLLTHYILLLMDTNGAHGFLVMLAVSLVLHAYVNTAQMQFQFVLSQLCRQFAFVNNELRRILEQMASNGGPPLQLAARLRLLARMHLDFYRHTERIFRYFQAPTIIILMKSFTTNVSIIYHSWLFLNHSLSSDFASNAVGSMLNLAFYVDAWLFLNLLQRVLNECNTTGGLLREFLDFDLVTRPSEVSEALNEFADHLRCHKLAFQLCGLFELNMATSVEFFLQVFVQVSVLMQFDIKRAMETN